LARANVFIFLLSAIATDKNICHRVGDRHATVACVKGETVEETEATLEATLVENGWRDYAITKVAKAASEAEIEEAVQNARKLGVALTVFADPIRPN
jgi:urease accessory protein UreE